MTSDDLSLLARDLDMAPRRMRHICADIAEAMPVALAQAGEKLEGVLPGDPFSTEDLWDDIRPWHAVIRHV